MDGVSATVATPMPPGPTLPRALQTLGFILVPGRFIDACHRRYGDIVTFGSLFDPRFVMVFEPELVKQVFRGSPEQLRAGEANALLGPVVGERSLLLLDGAEHLRQRKLLLPPFHGERMRAYEDVIAEAADRTIASWPVDEPFALLGEMRSLTLDVIMRAVFGVAAGPAPGGAQGPDPRPARAGVLTARRHRARPVAGPVRGGRRAALRGEPAHAGRVDPCGDRPAARGARPRGARRRPLHAAARA